jgi:hypothetical protein
MSIGNNIEFDYAGGTTSAPINVDWARELGLFDCETHELNADRYPLRCADGPATTTTTATAVNPLLAPSTAGVLGDSLMLPMVAAAVGVFGFAAYLLTPNKKAPLVPNHEPTTDPTR